jgi:hypothetical protein
MGDGLADQHAIERVPVAVREHGELQRCRLLQRQWRDAVAGPLLEQELVRWPRQGPAPRTNA